MRSALFALALALAPPALAQTTQDAFDVRFGAIRVAQLILAVNDTGSGYALAGRAESTGLVAVFRALRFDMAATGTRTSGRLSALTYREDIDTGRRASTVEMRWQGGVPVIDAQSPAGPAEPWHIDPQAQTGTIDPLSALYSLARPRAEGALCNFTQTVFDGRRRSSLSLGPVRAEGAMRVCAGAYTRVAGFSPEEMAEQTRFPFTATFAEITPGQWALTSVDLASLYGPVEIVRTE